MSKDARKKRPHKKTVKAVEAAKASRAGGAAAADREAMKLDEASGEDPGPPAPGRSTMQPDTPPHAHSDAPHSDDHRGPMDGAAAIAPVTDAMMDHAAHEAAALADGVAQGTVVLDRASMDAEAAQAAVQDAARDVAGAAAESAAELSHRAAEAAGEATGTLSDAAADGADAVAHAAEGTARVAEAAAREASRAVERGTEAAQASLSASADALTQYNAKVMEVMRSNLAATTELFAALVQAKSVPEALSLNADHIRNQVEAMASQGRELAMLAQRIALDAMQPFKGALDR